MMNRSQILLITNFMESMAVVSAKVDDFFSAIFKSRASDDIVVGHNGYQYKVRRNWGIPEDPAKYPVKDCHEMVIDSSDHLYMLTNHKKNNVITYNLDGRIIDSWTLGFESAHGLSIARLSGKEYLYICDYKTETVVKTTLHGKVLSTLPTPKQLGIYAEPDRYLPTGTAIASNGDVFVADGYGSSFVIQFDSDGNYIRHFGGRGKAESSINSAHGIAIDNREGVETVLITSREDCCFIRFTLDGRFLEKITIPGAYVCRPVIHSKNIYAGVCWSNKLYSPNTGFVTILDENNRVISNPGGIEPIYDGDKLKWLKPDQAVFKHCHDVCVDADENIYVCQWNAGGSYPVKLERL